MTVFVTGATGYLGQALVRALRTRGQEVRALLRPDGDARILDLAEIETTLGDVRDAASVRNGMNGCQAVVHAAALTGGGGRLRDYEETNVGGLRNVLDAAWHHKIPKVLYVSCFVALGPTSGAVLDETHRSSDRRGASPYEASLRAADRMTHSYLSGWLPLAVVYPGLLYGPGPVREGNLVSRLLLDHAKRRISALPARGENRVNLAYVDDVAMGVCRALERAEPGERFLLGGDNVTLKEFFSVLPAVAGARAPATLRRSVPTGAAATLAKIGAAFRGRPLSQLLLEMMEHDWAYDSSHAFGRLGFDPRPLRDGLRLTVDYLYKKGQFA